MKICETCNHSNEDGATFCRSCGQSLEYPKSAPNGELISDGERVLASLTNGVAINLLTGAGARVNGAVLTDKRLYYREKSGILCRYYHYEKVDLKDITGTKIGSLNPIILLILAILSTIACVACCFLFLRLLLILTPVTLALYVWYFLSIKSVLKIEYPGGDIRFSIREYKKEDVHNFQKMIHIAKEKL